VLIGSTTGNELVAVNADDGSMAWRARLPSRGVRSLAAQRSKIFIGAQDGLWALDRVTGKSQKMLSSKISNITVIPSPAGGAVFVGDLEGNLYAIQ
jgi:outer membrane protein assembly factor BamB